MRKLFVSAIALLFVSQIAISAESNPDIEDKVTKTEDVVLENPKKTIEKDSSIENSEKAVESEEATTEENAEEKTIKEKEDEKTEEAEKKEDIKAKDSEKETEKVSEEKTTAEQPAEQETVITKSKDSESAALPTIESRDFLQDVNTVLSCMNQDLIAAEPITTETGWAILIEVREDIVSSLISKDSDNLIKLLIKSENANPTLLQMVENMLILAVNELNDETIEILKKVNLIKNETFQSWLKKNNLDARYSSKVEETSEKNQSFIAIPLVYSKADNKLTIDFSKTKNNIEKQINIVSEIQTSEKEIEKQLAARNEKISPEMQKSLDELKSLEDENKVLTKKLDDEKARVSTDIETNQKEKTDAENILNTKHSDIDNLQKELNTLVSQKTSKQTRLNNLNNTKTRSAELRNMKNETGNKRLNINTAKTQTQTQINELNNRIGTLQTSIQSVQTEISDAENKIKEASEKVTELQSGIDSIETLKTNNENQIKELKQKSEIARALVYAEDFDKEIEDQVDKTLESFNQLLTA